MKKLLSIFLVIAMLVTTCAVSAAHYTDIDGHWAQKEIEAWSDYGVISGYDGKFSPNRSITRGEFAVVLSRLMGYQKESANTFNDLPDKFYTSYVLKLFSAGVMQGYDGFIRPEDSLTREEASVIICRALGISTADVMNRDFADVADISDWAKGYINSMVNTGLLNGAEGKLNPKNPIMRSEVIKILDNAVYPLLKAGTYEKASTNKILVISAGDVTVKNSEIKGNILVTQGVLTGKISFVDSKIEKTFVIDNDRSSYIELKNTTVADKSVLTHKAFINATSGGGTSGGGTGGSTGGTGGSTGGTGGTTGGTGGSDVPTSDPTITVGSVSADAGQEVTIPVSIANNVGLTGLTISIGYDSAALSLTGYEAGTALTGLTFTRPGDNTANPVNFLWDGTDADATNGNILLLKFRVADNAAGTYSIDATVTAACDANVEDIIVKAVDGKITVAGAIKVTFFEGYGSYAEEIDEVQLALGADGKAVVQRGDIPSQSFPWDGYEKKDYLPSNYADYNGKHEVEPEFWYKENGEWKPFKESTVLTQNTNAYLLFSELSVNALGTAVVIKYDKNSRAMDTAKTFLDKAIPQLRAAKEAGISAYEELTSKILGMLEDTGLVDSDKFINNIKFSMAFSDALVESDKDSVNDAINGDGNFEIVPENIDLFNMVHDELLSIGFDAVLESESGTAIDAMVSLVGYDICEEIFNGIRNEYCSELADIIADVESETVSSATIPSTLIMVFDTVEDIMKPLYDEAEEKVISEFDSSLCYDENPYLQYLTEDLDVFAELLTKVDNGTEDRTGYRLKDLITCLEYMTKFTIVTDDALCWYDDIDDVDYDTVYDALYATTMEVFDRFDSVLNNPQFSEKLPDGIKTAFQSIQQVEEMFLNIRTDFGDTLGIYVDSKTDVILSALFNDNGRIRAKLQELVDSGELYSKVDDFVNSSMGQGVDERFIEDVVALVENIAENGISYYKVPTSGETVIDKYEFDLGDYTFSVTRNLQF